jgi:hypothetical protein
MTCEFIVVARKPLPPNCCTCMLQSVLVGLVERILVLSNEALGVQ